MSLSSPRIDGTERELPRFYFGFGFSAPLLIEFFPSSAGGL